MVNRIAEEGADDAEALPETVHSVLAARLDALPRIERRVRPGGLGGRPDLLGGVGRRRGDEHGIDLVATLESLREQDLVVPTAGSRLAGEREYAFKHVLIRDVAYSTLPKAVRARQPRRGRRVHRRPRRRPLRGRRGDGRRALLARGDAGRRGRSRAGRAGGGSRSGRSRRSRRPATRSAALYSNREAQGHYETALALERRARRLRRRRGSPRSSATSPCGWGASTARSSAWTGAMEYHRGAGGPGPGRRPAPQDRRRPLAEGRPRGLDRALPARHRPAQGRPAVPRAGAPLRGGGLALHAHRRQHARDLRLGEGAAAGRAARRGGRGQPRPRDLRPRVRAHRRLRARPREPRALGRAGPRERSRGGGPGAARARLPPRDLRGRLRRRRAAPTARRSAIALRTGDLPSQVELHAALAQVAAYRGDWETGERETDASQELAEREGLIGKLCFPYSMRGVLLWHAGRARRGGRDPARRAVEIGRPGRALGGRLRVAALARRRAARPRRPRRRRPDARASARPLRARRPRRPVGRGDRGAGRQPGALGQGRGGGRGRRGGRRARRAPALPGRGRRRDRGARRRDRRRPRLLAEAESGLERSSAARSTPSAAPS